MGAGLGHQGPEGGRLDRLSQHCDTQILGRALDRRTAIGGDQNGRERQVDLRAQGGDDVKAVALVQMVVGKNDVGTARGAARDRQGLFSGLDRPYQAAPVLEQRRHSRQDFRFVVDHQDGHAAQMGVGDA